jgi:hypothetical protein
MGIGAMSGAQASLTLNATGIADGFSLSTYYNDPVTNYGVLSLANGPGGVMYAAGYARGELYKFADVDGQTFASRTATASAGGSPTGIASVGGQVYVGLLGQTIYKVDSSLNVTPVTIVNRTWSFDYGMWANPVTGHLIASTSSGLIDVDPITGIWTQIGPSGLFVDGVTVSPDGKVAYGADTTNQRIVGYSLVAPNPAAAVIATGFLGHGPDGTGIITGGLFDGDIVVNNNDGTLGLIDHVTGLETIIASNGSRGDLVSADLSNGTLLLDQSEGVLRLSCGPDCFIGGPPPTETPEPMTLSIVAFGLLGIARSRRRKAA